MNPLNIPPIVRKARTKKPYQKPASVKQLEAIMADDYLTKHPSLPPLSYKFRDDNANGLTKCIITFLELKGWQAERISVTGRPIDNRKTYTDVLGHKKTIGSITWVKSSMTKGSSDVSSTIYGMAVKWEVKIGSDSQKDEQKDYQKAIESAKGKYYIVKSFDEFLQYYDNLVSKLSKLDL
jgi:hypothetical protein